MDQQQLNGSALSEASTDAAPSITPAKNNDTTTPPPFPPPPLAVLKTCTIRPWHPSDAESAARHGNDPLIAQWMTNMFPHPYTPERAHEWIAMNESAAASPPLTTSQEPPLTWPALLNHAIALPSPASECVGGIGLKPGLDVRARSAEVGYWVGAAAWGRGVATEALAAYAAHAFAACPALERLDASVYAGNAASARVLEKCGFVREGVRRRAVWKWGEWRDEEVWGLLRGEWEARSGGGGGA